MITTHTKPVYYPVGADCQLYHAYWDGSAIDHSSHGNDGIVNGPLFAFNGLSFDGINDYVTVASPHNLENPTGDFSAFGWVKFATDASGYNALYATDIGAITSSMLFSCAVNPPTTYFYTIWPYPLYEVIGNSVVTVKGQWVFVGYQVERGVGGYFAKNGINIIGPVGGVVESPPGIQSLAGFYIGYRFSDSAYPLKGIIGEFYYFHSILADSGLSIFNFTKSRYGL
jgi:hypothetical protein